ncbi:aspartate aminotransferase family protein, partial [Streptomyces asiaticus]
AELLPEIESIALRNIPELLVGVRGRGLLIGVELTEAGLAGELLIELFNHGVVANHSMNGSSVIRFTPPAVLARSDVEFLLDSFDKATRDLIDKQATMPRGADGR